MTDGARLLSAVERLLDDPDAILGVVERLRRQNNGDALLDAIVDHYSDRTGVSGALSALPAAVPGLGTLLALTGGTLADIAMLLKYETEMAMALSWAFGHDIRRPDERRRALLLASIQLFEAKTARNFFVDVAEAEARGLWTYAPREVARLLALSLGRLLMVRAGQRGIAFVPVVGAVVGASVNKSLTRSVGQKMIEALRARPKPARDFVDARVAGG